MKYIYILSQRYSGSTLLSFLLATHPDIATIGERRKFYNKSIRPNPNENQECSCGQKFENCNFWSKIKKRLLTKVSKKDLKTNVTEFRLFNNKYAHWLAGDLYKFSVLNGFSKAMQPFGKRMSKMVEINQILVEEILALENCSTFLDSSKAIDHALYLSQIHGFDFYVIWLARDPRAQVHSALKYNDWAIGEATQHWVKEMKANEEILKKTGIRHSVLQYELLCRNPESEMHRILDFVGLDPTKFSLDFRNKEQHIMGNRSMRLGKDTKIKERKEWQTALSKTDIATIEKLTFDYQKYYAS